MAFLTDSLRGAIEAVGRLNPFSRGSLACETALPGIFSHQLALAAYMSSGMLRKVITLPAADRTQKWRDWQADKPTIELIEKEEKRLALRAKVKQAEVLRGIGGGALILVTAGDHASELKPETIQKGGLIAVNVVSRWEITAEDFDKELASPTYRMPRRFRIDSDGRQATIHPSRVIPFRGDPIPAGTSVSDEEAYWGDSQLLRVFGAVQNSDHAQTWFVELIRKAKLLRIGIPDLLDMMGSESGKQQLNERIALIASSESTLNATVYRSGTGADDPGEKIDDYQINWSGIPAFMDAIDQRMAAVSGIPFTKIMGRSPAGMNSTGESDERMWWDTIGDGQENETRPCLEQLDPVLIRSAGVAAPDKVWWLWAPLRKPTEKEEAETFGLVMDAITKLIDSGMVPEEAMARAVQNLIEERGYMPGLADALKKIPEAERFGLTSEDDGTGDDPSTLQAGKEGDPVSAGGGTTVPARRAANDAATGFFADAAPRPLYVQRKLLNGAALIAWAKENGFKSTLSADDLHVTVLYSKTAVDPLKLGNAWGEDDEGRVRVKPGGPRAIERFGENAVVLLFASWELESRHRSMVEAGGSHDFDEYHPHITLSYEVPDGVDLTAIKPYAGALEFGEELFEPLDLDWKRKVTEE